MIPKSAKILITGSTGMMGASLVKYLKQKGYNNLLTPPRNTLDLTQQLSVHTYITKAQPEYIFHLAAEVGGIAANQSRPADFIYYNTIMQTHIINAAYNNHVKKLLFPGSACAYPNHINHPIEETDFLNGPIEPTNLPYAIAKINGILMCQAFAKQYNLQVSLPMITNAYGENDHFKSSSSHVIPALIDKIHTAKLAKNPYVKLWGSGKPIRDFIFADDVSSALLFLMSEDKSEDIINVSAEQNVSISTLANTIATVIGYKGDILFDPEKPDGALHKSLCAKKIKLLGWKPTYNLLDGLQKTYRSYLNKQGSEAPTF